MQTFLFYFLFQYLKNAIPLFNTISCIQHSRIPKSLWLRNSYLTLKEIGFTNSRNLDTVYKRWQTGKPHKGLDKPLNGSKHCKQIFQKWTTNNPLKYQPYKATNPLKYQPYKATNPKASNPILSANSTKEENLKATLSLLRCYFSRGLDYDVWRCIGMCHF